MRRSLTTLLTLALLTFALQWGYDEWRGPAGVSHTNHYRYCRVLFMRGETSACLTGWHQHGAITPVRLPTWMNH